MFYSLSFKMTPSSSLLRPLRLDQLRIAAPRPRRQLSMSPHLENDPAVHNGDAIRIADGGEAVGYDQACAANLEGVEECKGVWGKGLAHNQPTNQPSLLLPPRMHFATVTIDLKSPLGPHISPHPP